MRPFCRTIPASRMPLFSFRSFKGTPTKGTSSVTPNSRASTAPSTSRWRVLILAPEALCIARTY